MSRQVAFLRAINVGGHTVTMARLRELFEGLGFARVETFIASGNVIFETGRTPSAALEERIARRLQSALGYEVVTFIRTEAEVAAIARATPFEQSEIESARAFCVGFLSAPLAAAARKALKALETEFDRFHTEGRELYWLCHVRQGQSTFSNMAFEKRVGVRTTLRGMPTMVRLAKKLAL